MKTIEETKTELKQMVADHKIKTAQERPLKAIYENERRPWQPARNDGWSVVLLGFAFGGLGVLVGVLGGDAIVSVCFALMGAGAIFWEVLFFAPNIEKKVVLRLDKVVEDFAGTPVAVWVDYAAKRERVGENNERFWTAPYLVCAREVKSTQFPTTGKWEGYQHTRVVGLDDAGLAAGKVFVFDDSMQTATPAIQAQPAVAPVVEPSGPPVADVIQRSLDELFPKS